MSSQDENRPIENRVGNPNVIEKRRTKRDENVKLLRMDIVAQLYKRGFTYREIRDEVKKRLNLPTYSLSTVKHDVDALLREWQAIRIEETDQAIALELQRIDELVKEAWNSWEQSKEDYLKEKTKLKGTPAIGSSTESPNVRTKYVEKTSETLRSVGDPRFLDTINRLLMERRKLLGLYAPEKQEVKTNLSFADFLMKTGRREQE